MLWPPLHTERKMTMPFYIRVMGGIVIVELVCLVLFLVWPKSSPSQPFVAKSQAPAVTQLQASVITVQNNSSAGSPQPQNPLPPIPVPNDQPIKQEIKINLHKYVSNSNNSSELAPPGSGGSGSGIVGNPNVSPRVTRIVEPTYQIKLKNRYEIAVKFLVNKKGTVDDASIIEIYQLDKNGDRKKKVKEINPTIRKAVIKAAKNWEFKPAKDHGKVVRAYTKNYFTV